MGQINVSPMRVIFLKLLICLTYLPLLIIPDFVSPKCSIAQVVRRELATQQIHVADMGAFQYVALSDLADYLGIRMFYSDKVRKVILYVGNSEVKVTAMNPFIQINDRMLQIPVETRYNEDDILVPIPYFTDLIRPLYPKQWPENIVTSKSIPSKKEANITKIKVNDKANGTLIRLSTTKKFKNKNITSRLSRNWLYVDIVDGKIAPDAVIPLNKGGTVEKVSPVQAGSMAQISFRLRKEIDPELVTISSHGNEILVSIPTEEMVSKDVLTNLENDRQKWLIDTIVLDPGHGGRDPGAIGPKGIQEKNITLKVAKRLRRLLESKLKVKVLMTRDKDVFVKLDERTSLANSAQGKLFISIHCNSNRNRRVKGSSTYFLGLAKTDESLEVALRENAVVEYEGDLSGQAQNEQEFILTAMAQNSFNHESEELAAIVQKDLNAVAKLPNRGVHQAGFRVLIGASMPNILVELAFISNPQEERLLNSNKHQNDMAQAIFKSIKKFKEKYEVGS